MRAAFFLVIATGLTACGAPSSYNSPGVTRFATGPLYSACMSSDRKARSRALCGCVQAQADRDLRGGDQRLAKTFFRDPHRAQEVKMSKRPRDDDFWDRYKQFAANAERSCQGL